MNLEILRYKKGSKQPFQRINRGFNNLSSEIRGEYGKSNISGPRTFVKSVARSFAKPKQIVRKNKTKKIIYIRRYIKVRKRR